MTSSDPTSPPDHHHDHEHFSFPLFALTVLLWSAVLLAGLRYLAPSVWSAEWAAPWWKALAAFGVVSLFNCFLEYFFHRYVLHTPAVPWLRRFYRQHTLHHALTRIARKPGRNGSGVLFIENKFPIEEPEQGEASFFPWYTLGVFALLIAPLLALLHAVAPTFPWFLGGFAALAASLILYEVLHAINHWPFETWEPLLQHPRWGWLWRPAYGFHLRHHAVTDCNESISGFFGLPVADWVFRTCIIPQTIYADGEEWSPEKFQPPHPRGVIRWLDRWAENTVQRRRQAVGAGSASAGTAPRTKPGRTYSHAEEVANWVTHGIGLALSIVGFTLLIVFASQRGDAWHVVSFTVFGLTLLALYAISTLYHAQRDERRRILFRKLDHAAIFLLIAGTYTPFLLTNLRGPWGWSLFGIVWGICGAGAVFQLLFAPRYRLVSLLAYVFVGWLVVVAVKPMLATVPHGGLWLLLGGGVSYTLGILFYRWHRLRFHHAVWHTFVLAGSACHFLSILLYLLPHDA